jgi:hypothetical protein
MKRRRLWTVPLAMLIVVALVAVACGPRGDPEALSFRATQFREIQVDHGITSGEDGNGADVQLYSDTSGDHFLWDASAEALIVTGSDGQDALQVADGDLDVVDDIDLGGNLDVDGTTSLDGLDLDGNQLDLDADDDTSLAADTDDRIDFEIGGADIYVMNDFGASTITTDTTEHLVEIQDATPVMTDGTNVLSALNIDLGIGNSTAGTNSVHGILIDSISADAQNTEDAISVGSGWDYAADFDAAVTIDGGLTDIGGGSYATADGDNDLGVAGDAEVDGALDVDGTANVAGAVTFQGAFYSSFTDLAVSNGDTITPTYTTYALDSSGAVTVTLAASAQEGQLLVLIGDDANDITIADTNIRTNDGNAQVLNQYDVLMLVYQDSEWIEISNSDNS